MGKTKLFCITGGDPAGVGPEILLKLLSTYPKLFRNAIIITNKNVLKLHSSILGINIPEIPVVSIDDLISQKKLDFPVILEPDVKVGMLEVGRGNESTGRLAFEYLRIAFELIKTGVVNGVLTLPVSKYWVEKAVGEKFLGHTEFFAENLGVKEYTMAFWTPELAIALVTRHIPLKDVPDTISRKPELIEITIKHLHTFIKELGWGEEIYISGLNPHAGEGGIIGGEEKYIKVVIEKVKGEGIKVYGPFAGDTVLLTALRNKVKAIVYMYHDQGLGAFKALYFDKAVNVTLGLPIVRVSPDHGVGYDIVGKGVASPKSTFYALKLLKRLL